MGADGRLSAVHKNHLLHLWEVIQPVRDEEHDLILRIRLQVRKHGILGLSVERGEGVIQNQDRPGMCERSRQCQTLRLSARQARTAAADDRINAVFHRKNFVFQCGGVKIRHRILFTAAEDIVFQGVRAQLRVMAQITDRCGNLSGREGGELLLSELSRTAIRRLAEEHPSEGRFATGDGAGHADDITGMGGQAQAGEDRGISVTERKVFQGHISGFRNVEFFQLLRRFHQRLDALPRNFGLLHRVKQLCDLGRLDDQLGEAGKEGRKGRDIPRTPAGAKDILCAEPQDKQHAGFRRRQIQRRKGRLPHIAAHRGLFVVFQCVFVFLHPGVLTAVNAVGHSVLRTVQRSGTQRACGLFVCRTSTLNGLFHPRCADIRHRGENQTEQCQPPVVHQQHHRIADQCNTCIENFGGEFSHTLHAVVHIGDCFRHQLACALFFERRPALTHQIRVKDALHPAVDVVCKPADIEAFEKAR